MKTRCPACKTRYEIPPEALLEADGLARCFRCGTVFEIVAEGDIEPNIIEFPAERPAYSTDEYSVLLPDDLDTVAPSSATPTEDNSVVVRSVTAEETGSSSRRVGSRPATPEAADKTKPAADEPEPLPFAVPDGLEPLEPSPEAVQTTAESLQESSSGRGFLYGLLIVLLLAGLGLQLAWQQRQELFARYPVLQPLCEYITCAPETVRAPDRIRILQRDISPTAGEPGWLTLSARIRNDAEHAQPLPDLQLSLVDSAENVLVRRRLTPPEYLGQEPPREGNMATGEVVTISVDFKDPGREASGFVIDFY